MADIAPMLSVLGYDPYANPPDYGKADSWVKDNTLKVCQFSIGPSQCQCCRKIKNRISSLTIQVKAEEKLWQNRANQLLQRNDFGYETSNLDDTDSPDGNGGGGANNDIHNKNNNRDETQT